MSFRQYDIPSASTPRWCRLPSVLVVLGGLLLCAFSCNRLSPDRRPLFVSGPSTIGDGGVGVSSQVEIDHPLFAGLTEFLAGDETIDLRWEPASDDNDAPNEIRYRVYLATSSGDQSFATPWFETSAGETRVSFPNLMNGLTLFAVVRAVDTEGNEDPNTVEWYGTPNPVRFVGGPGGGGAPDGLSPGTAYPTVGQAVSAGLSLSGVNFHVAGGSYSENVFLFEGMALYGGFTSAFSFEERDFVTNPTEFSSGFPVDLVTMVPGVLPIVLDGCVLSGNTINETGILIEDVSFQVTNCEVRDMVIHGVEIRSDVAEADPVTGTIRGCSITRSGGEGMTIVALGDIVIDNNQVTNNTNEGIESQWLFAESGQTTRIEVTRNRLRGNGDEGIDLDFAELSETDPTLSQGGRVRVLIRANDIAENALAGIQLDLDFETSDQIDFEARVEDNRISSNRGGGVLIDGDARGSFRLARNVITANGTAGVVIQGTPDGPWCRILNSRILGNDGPGVSIRDHAGVELRNCAVGYNANGAVRSPRAWVEAVNCLLVGNRGDATAIAVLRNSTVFSEGITADLGPGVSAADPLLENWPEGVSFSVAPGGASEVRVADPALFAVGDTIELRDDGVARIVESVLSDRITFSPSLNSGTAGGEAVFAYGRQTDVDEREGLLEGSPAIDSGDPLESDRDGSIVDHGPIGGETPGNVGIETGLAAEAVPSEVEMVRPLPSLLIASASSTVQFRRTVDAAFQASVSLTVGGIASGAIFGASLPDELSFSASSAAPVGERFGVDLAPVVGSAPDANDRQPHHVTYESRVALVEADSDPLGGDDNGSVATAQSMALPVIVEGGIGTPGDSDHYRLSLVAGDVLRIDLIARRRESALVASVSILSSDGSTVFASEAANPPTTLDPTLDHFTAPSDGEYVVRVGSVDGSGSAAATYELQLSVR